MFVQLFNSTRNLFAWNFKQLNSLEANFASITLISFWDNFQTPESEPYAPRVLNFVTSRHQRVDVSIYIFFSFLLKKQNKDRNDIVFQK